MPNVEKLSIALTSEQLDIVREAVSSGEYASASEVVQEAIGAWRQKWETRRTETSKLRDLWDEGKASGTPASVDFDQLRLEARERLKDAVNHGR